MSAIAIVLAEMGHAVTGSDIRERSGSRFSIVSEMQAEVATESQLAVLPAKVTDWVKEYEATHPKVTRILNDIATTLSNMGI